MNVLYQPDYAALLDGDVQCALMLSQLVYWYRPGKEGKSRLRVFKQTDGKWWIAKSWQEWQDECGFSRAQSRRCLTKLQAAGLIELKVYRFNGAPTTHVRFPWVASGKILVDIPTAVELRQLRSAGSSAVLANDPSQSTVAPPPVQKPSAASPLATSDQSITVITSDTTTIEKEQEGGKEAALLPIPPNMILTKQNQTGAEEIKKTDEVKEQKQKDNKEIQSELTDCEGQGQTCVLISGNSDPSGQQAPPGWMKAGNPLPKALMPIPDNKDLKALIQINTEGVPAVKKQDHFHTSIPTSAKAGPLGAYWKARLDELEPTKYHAKLKKEEFGMLAHLGTYLGDEAGKVIDFVLRHWSDFGWEALDNAGVKAYPPEEPNISFLLKYYATAVNMMLSEMQSIAKKKADEEALAKKQAQAKEAEKAAEAQKPKEAPITKLRLTKEQLNLYLNLDVCDGFIDKVTEKYGKWTIAYDKDALPCEIDFELAG